MGNEKKQKNLVHIAAAALQLLLHTLQAWANVAALVKQIGKDKDSDITVSCDIDKPIHYSYHQLLSIIAHVHTITY